MESQSSWSRSVSSGSQWKDCDSAVNPTAHACSKQPINLHNAVASPLFYIIASETLCEREQHSSFATEEAEIKFMIILKC